MADLAGDWQRRQMSYNLISQNPLLAGGGGAYGKADDDHPNDHSAESNGKLLLKLTKRLMVKRKP